MCKPRNIAIYATRNSETELDIRYLLKNSLLLNSDKNKENGSINEDKNEVFSEEKLITKDVNLQLKTSDLVIPIDPNLDSILLSPNMTATNVTTYRQDFQKAKLNVNKKFNTGLCILPIKNLDLSSYNLANGSSSHKQKPINIIISLKLVKKAIKKQEQL